MRCSPATQNRRGHTSVASGTGIGFTCGVLSLSLFAGLAIVGDMTSAGWVTRFGVELNVGSAAAANGVGAAASAPELDAAAEVGFIGVLAASVLGGMTSIVLVAAFFSLVS